MVQLPYPDELEDLLSYIAGMNLKEIDTLQARTSHPSGDGTLSDEELARLLFAQEAEGLLNVTKDYTTGSSHRHSLLEELTAMETMARYDREVALAISEDRPIPPPPISMGSRPFMIEIVYPGSDTESDSVSSSSSSSLSGNSEDDHSAGEDPFLDNCASTEPQVEVSSPGVDSEPDVEREECTICGDTVDIRDLYFAPCGHPFDIGCLQELFQKAAADESLYPPGCCSDSIPLHEVRHYFEERFNESYEKKSREFSTKNRVYCHRPTCSSFLGPSTDDPSVLECQECFSPTCGACKQRAHVGRTCSEEQDKPVLDLASLEGWKRCHSCQHMVELERGCYHMICICKAQFCYLCAAPWKECSCPFFEEHRL